MTWWIALLNSVAALASAGFGVVALVRPGVLAPRADRDATTHFYPAMYAGRAVPLGVAVAIAVWLPAAAPAVPLLLGTALVAQAADVVIGVAHRLPGMVAGAAFAVACHGAAVVSLL